MWIQTLIYCLFATEALAKNYSRERVSVSNTISTVMVLTLVSIPITLVMVIVRGIKGPSPNKWSAGRLAIVLAAEAVLLIVLLFAMR